MTRHPNRWLTAFALLATLPSVTHATTYQVAGDWLADKNGNGINNDTLVVLVVDLNRDGILDPTASDFTPGQDDAILGTLHVSDFGGLLNKGSFASDINVATPLGGSIADTIGLLNAGDPLWLLWFPELAELAFTNDPLTQPGVTSFGKFTSSTATLGGDAWLVSGNESATVPLTILSDTAGNKAAPGGNIPKSVLTASFTTIPEPTSALLGASALLLLLAQRRRLPS